MDSRMITAIGLVVIGLFFLFVQPYIPAIFRVRSGPDKPTVNKGSSRVVGVLAIVLAVVIYFAG